MTMLSPEKISELVTAHAIYIEHNRQLIDIWEGCLLKYILADMQKQFSPQMYEQAKFRTVPINVVPKIIGKLTSIYQTSVTRQVIEGGEGDKKLLSWYQNALSVNTQMNSANEMFNLCRAALVQPYAHKGKPCLRVLLNDKFIVYSDDPINPHIPTHIILLAGKNSKGVDLYYTYSAEEFLISNAANEVEYGLMAACENPDGINPYGRLPFTYVNESHYRVAPKQDSDILALAKVIPIMLTDLNVAAMYQSYSVMYAIDLDDDNIVWGPNSFLRFKSDPATDKKPELGMLKPTVDFEQVLGLIQSELSIWLGTKGIRAASIGQLGSDSFASGFSKMIDEMDTFEAREKQVAYFLAAEDDLWNLTLKTMHPHWVNTKQVDQKALFTPNASVETTFAVQLPTQNRGQVVKDLEAEQAAGFITRRGALLKLNPDMTSEEIDALIVEIDKEKSDGSKMDQNQPRNTQRLEA